MTADELLVLARLCRDDDGIVFTSATLRSILAQLDSTFEIEGDIYILAGGAKKLINDLQPGGILNL